MTIRILLALCFLVTFTPSSSVPEEHAVDYSKYFGAFKGTFVLYDLNSDSWSIHNNRQSKKRFSPCSTFKIINALIALDTGVARDETYVLGWDGTQYPIENWNRSHTLESAMENSVVWYFQELARQIGKMRMNLYMRRFKYGNRDITGGLDQFWLGSSLKISAREQVAFLQRFYSGELPFSRRSMDIVKNMIVLEKTDSYTLRGKTGTEAKNGKSTLGWFVGWVERDENVYIFAANIKGKNSATGAAAKEITLSILRDISCL